VNPYETAVLKKTFRHAKGRQWIILEKDAVDEIIFRTENPRKRLMLELMARGGVRIGEVLKLSMMDVEDCKMFLVSPKNGRQNEVVFIPKRLAAGSGNISDPITLRRRNEFFTSATPEPEL